MPLLRLIPLALLAFVAAVLVGSLLARANDTRRPNAYRPKQRWGAGGAGEPGAAPGTAHLATRATLAGLRDALTSAPIDPSQSLARCGGCQAVYHQSSLAALAHENGGQCVACGGRDLATLTVLD